MPDPLGLVDSSLAVWLPPLVRIALWGIATAAMCMGLYALISPSQKLLLLRNERKQIRVEIMQFEGNWNGLRKLLGRDILLALREITFLFFPVLISMLPFIVGLMLLSDIYGQVAYINFGPDWVRGFEFWYVAIFATCSMIIKYTYGIA